MNTSTKPGDTACGEIQTTMVRINLWGLEEMHKTKEKRRYVSN
jgi:hypothetical protein